MHAWHWYSDDVRAEGIPALRFAPQQADVGLSSAAAQWSEGAFAFAAPVTQATTTIGSIMVMVIQCVVGSKIYTESVATCLASALSMIQANMFAGTDLTQL